MSATHDKKSQNYSYSSLGCIPMALGSILNVQSSFDSKLSIASSIQTYNNSTQIPFKLFGIPDSLLIDACEFMNAIYEDMS